ncbi:MAG: RtcB family protein [Thaumarchaeota archaeon]|nr:RtcB family protein [Nitrososphaerota archaeon]
MNVPARIYASKKLLDAMDSGVIEQATNVACLPGIVRYSYAMADAHWGYGFPIGGVAAFDAEKGVISPGGVGFDVNCLHPDSRIYDENGIWRRIGDAEVQAHGFLTFDVSAQQARSSKAILRQQRLESEALLKIRTKGGKQILVTSDHPILTRNGMVEAGKITATDLLLTSGVEGVEYTRPSGLEIVTPESLDRTMEKMGITERGRARSQVLRALHERGLDSLKLSDLRTAQILKLLGFIFGDGAIPEVESGQYTSFYGKEEDLADIKADLASLGYSAHAWSRKRHHRIETAYGPSGFDYTEHSLQSPATSFAVLMVTLGAPYGKKTNQTYGLPRWLLLAEKWQKKLFLAAYFGAELATPRTVNGYNFQMPDFSVSKLVRLSDSAVRLLEDFRVLLHSLGVESSEPARVEGYNYQGVDGPSTGYRVGILSNTENLLKFFGEVGYLYNREKQRLASLSFCYLSFLERIRAERNRVREQALQMYSAGAQAAEIIRSLATETAGPSFIRHSIWGGRGGARIWQSEKFEDFVRANEAGRSGLVYDQVQSIESVPYEGLVHDLTIGDSNHNFVAEGIVVSNCGMRLIRTNLRYSEVKTKVKELVDLIFTLVPAGVGVKGSQGFAQSQMGDITSLGVKWCAEHDLAWDDDPEHVEEGGYIKGADISKVSRQAITRGVSQFGTLGSGNHYLEIQVVDPARFLDRDLAKEFGIVHDDQVMVMIHCGSRGFGHQVCTDYLRDFESGMRNFGIEVKDRDLACLPFSSKQGRDYYAAMVCAANFAFVNRQIIVNKVREAFSRVFHRDAEALDMHLIYDVCHNVAKVERHSYDGSSAEVLVHRKGATRSFGPGHPDVPRPYRSVGQPVIIGGSMETGSYLLVGTQKAMEDTFGSTAHGSGRTMSRTQAKREVRGSELQRKMLDRGIYVKAATMDGLAEEAGLAYKDISEVVETMDRAGISKKVAALRPVGNIKG